MKKWISGLVVALVSMAATAGFIDERTAKNTAAKPASATTAPSAAAVSPASAPAAVPEAPPAPPAKTWAVLPSDGTLSRALLRWAKTEQVNLVYEATADLPAMRVSYSGDFWKVLDELLADTARGSYPLHGCQFNNVTRILHVSQPCDR